MTARVYLDCCFQCGEVAATYCSECDTCPDCCDCEALFDADELGIDPEVDAERFERA